MRIISLEGIPSSHLGKSGWPWVENNPDISTFPYHQTWPRITVVTPSYNQGEYLEEAIRSVLLQNYPNLEYIIMDGGSTDNSIEIIHKYEPWLSYVHIGPDDGQSSAIAEGFQKSSGDILAWLNSDDRYLSGTLTRVAQFFDTHPECIFANGDVNYIDSDGKFKKRIYASRPNHFLTANLGKHGWPQQGCFWRRSAYEQVGGLDPSLQFCMDRDLFIRLTGLGPGKRIPGPPLADFRIHSLAKSSTIEHINKKESQMLLDKYGNPAISSKKRILNFFWLFWVKPTNLRSRFNRKFGWEW